MQKSKTPVLLQMISESSCTQSVHPLNAYKVRDSEIMWFKFKLNTDYSAPCIMSLFIMKADIPALLDQWTNPTYKFYHFDSKSFISW